MSPPTSRVQRWLLGTAEEPQETEPSAPKTRSNTQGPPLPTRSPDPERPKVRGLAGDVHALRRQQVLRPAEGAPAAPPAHADRSLPASLAAWKNPALEILAEARKGLDGFVSALISTSNGAVLAGLDLDPDSAAALAVATSAMAENLGVPSTALDLIALRLTTGDVVVCISLDVGDERITLRMTASGTALGVLMHSAQQVANSIGRLVATTHT